MKKKIHNRTTAPPYLQRVYIFYVTWKPEPDTIQLSTATPFMYARGAAVYSLRM